MILFVVAPSLSRVQLFAAPWTAAHQASLSFTVSWSFLKFMSIELVMLSNHLILCCPLLLLPSIFPNIRVFSKESTLHIRWPKYWSSSFSISPSNEHSWLISFRMTDLISLQSKGLSRDSSPTWQFKNINFSVLSLLYGPTLTSTHDYWKNQSFDGMDLCWPSLLFNTLSRLVMAFLPRSKQLLMSWLQSPSAVILEPKKTVCHCSHCFPTYLPWSDGTDVMTLDFWILSFKPTFSFSSFTFIKMLFSSSSLSCIFLPEIAIFLPAILIPVCASSSPAFCMMSSCKFNKQGDNI